MNSPIPTVSMSLAAALLLILDSAASSASAQAQAAAATAAPRTPDVVYVPTPPAVVDAMMRLAQIRKSDVVYDLGCGDGRIVIEAVKRGAMRGVCVDINPVRIAEAKQNAREAGVADRIRFLNQDLFETDIRDATVVALYLLPSLNLRLRPTLWQDLAPGTRVVSHAFDMGDWTPQRTVEVGGTSVYYWTIPSESPRAAARGTAM